MFHEQRFVNQEEQELFSIPVTWWWWHPLLGGWVFPVLHVVTTICKHFPLLFSAFKSPSCGWCSTKRRGLVSSSHLSTRLAPFMRTFDSNLLLPQLTPRGGATASGVFTHERAVKVVALTEDCHGVVSARVWRRHTGDSRRCQVVCAGRPRAHRFWWCSGDCLRSLIWPVFFLFFHQQPLQPSVYQAVCVKCNKPSEDGSKCQQCGSSTMLSSPTPRPPIRSQPSPGPNSLQQNFYKPVTTMRAPRGDTLPVRITSARGTLLPLSNGRTPLLAGTSSCCAARNPPRGKRTAAQQHELNDPSE